MKSILFTTTALVAFAGAAAADMSLSGEASAEYNTLDGYATAAEMTATASATLDNGITASTSFTLETTNFGSGEFGAGSVSLSSETASLTLGTAVVGAVRTAVGDAYAIGTGDDDAYGDGEIAGIAASVAFGETTVFVSGEINAITPVAATEEDDAVLADTTFENLEVGVTTTAGGWSLGLGFADGQYALTAAGSAGGADVNFGIDSTNDYNIGFSYPVGAVTVSAKTDEEQKWEIGAAYAADGMSAGIVVKPENAWELSAGYDADGIAVAASYSSAEAMSLGATYDMGNGLTIGAGIETAANVTTNYAFGNFALGGGATAFAEYADGAQSEVGPSERDIAAGTTVGVSFTF